MTSAADDEAERRRRARVLLNATTPGRSLAVGAVQAGARDVPERPRRRRPEGGAHAPQRRAVLQ